MVHEKRGFVIQILKQTISQVFFIKTTIKLWYPAEVLHVYFPFNHTDIYF